MKRFLIRTLEKVGVARAFAMACLALLIVVRIWDPTVVQIFRLKTFDYYQYLQPRPLQKMPVAIVNIDEKSLEDLGQWPWPRSTLARMLTNIRQMGAVAVAFDVVFAEPDRLSPGLYARTVPGLGNLARSELEALPDNDQLMANAMRTMRVVAGQAGRANIPAAERDDQKQVPVAVLGPDPRPYLLTYPKLLRNVPPIEDAASGLGLFSIFPDRDSIVRRAALASVADGKLQPSLAVELLRVGTGQNAFAIKSDTAGVKSIVVGGVEVPTDRNGRIWVHYTPHDSNRFVSASDVVAGTLDPNRLRNHLVLVGTSATGLLDLKATPLDPALPGVEVHAQILETILGKSYLTRPNYALGAELVITALLSLLVILLAPVLGAVPVLVFGFLVSLSWVSGSWYLFANEKILLDPVYPLFSSFLVFLLLVFVNYRREEVRRQEIRSAFGQYLAPEYVERIAEHPESLTLGGETRPMSILFSDVRGFTAISESFKDNPQGLTTLMNGFLTPLSQAILDHHGTIDKYMGDAIMAFWNAPLDDAQHERNACLAALDMIAMMKSINDGRRQQLGGDDPLPLIVGVGVNTGECVVGNMGSDFRFDYTVLGDAVNLASRLEGQSKTYGVPIILGHQTAAKAEDLAIVEIDLIRVKGKLEPERIYALIGDEDVARSDQYRQSKTNFESLLSAYRAQQWDVALAAADRIKGTGSEDFQALAILFQERIEAFGTTPPPPNWDGVYVAQTK